MGTIEAEADKLQAKAPSLPQPGVLLAMNDVPKGTDEEFTRWYHQEHLTERLALPGFMRARRYRSVDGQPNYMAVYDCDTVETLASRPYLQQLAHPTAWTQEIMPRFLNMQRSACRETWTIGEGTGGAAIVAHCKPIHGREEGARRFIREELGPYLMENACIVRIALWETNNAVTNVASMERDLRPGNDTVADWVLFIECTDLGQVALALHTHVLTGEGARTGLLLGSWKRYDLIYERHAAGAFRK
ncbi:DUF4286 family protein [Glaciimonas immobilis]|uniref:EthD domain-containing protein n=1 Tax=Glaciimonas immobilis TaxID=728004 RepID=A0A840RRY8_9BURK|nr:DUF4286 family protein [Glaciimonas immobilis]KAF3997068.1 hypothetical protein HAV38_15485 [Glaciimonas immobilis]MBB5199922.1 hypothetical protein [Glaciimonas immobilis]